MDAELKDGRVPLNVTKHIGYWKAEEFQKFAYPASEFVLGGLLPDSYYHSWVLLARITEMVYSTGRKGFTADNLELFTKLIRRHNILTEAAEGLKSCVITLHNLLHLPEDIRNFSTPDNYWYYSFERAVKNYIEHSSNCKNLECSFAKTECRREFLKFYFPIECDGVPCAPIDYNLVSVHACYYHFCRNN